MARAAATADVYSAIAEPRRREIINVLATEPATGNRGGGWPVGAIVEALGIPQPAVSKHLAVLREVGIVSATRRGRERRYRLNAGELKAVHDWAKTFERFWQHQLDRIRDQAERRAGEARFGWPTND